MRRVAVIGSGIAGLAAARALAPHAAVTLLEAGPWFGGHAHTVDVTLDGVTHGVDTGFLVFNLRTYPRLIALFKELDVATAPSEMSFSVQAPSRGLVWSGSGLDGVFAQRRNLLRPAFWGMLADILRFNRVCTGIARRNADAELAEPLGRFLQRLRFGSLFQEGYLLPMIGSIWSCPTDQMLQFPVGTLIRFCHNHGLLQATGQPPWRTVRGGSREYVRRMVLEVPDARLDTPVLRVQRLPPAEGHAGVLVTTRHGTERFDDVVMATHSDTSLSLLADATAPERAVLSAIRYHDNRAVLHTDASVLPATQRAWAAWNYERAPDAGTEQAAVCLHYLINRLQPLPWQRPVVVSLNPVREVDPSTVLGEWQYAHPVFDQAAIEAQRRLPTLQGSAGVWFCGAWTRYGFHEDGLMSGLAVAQDWLLRHGDAPVRVAA